MSIPGKIWLFGNFDAGAYVPRPLRRLEFVDEHDARPGDEAVVFSGYGDMFASLAGRHDQLLEELARIVVRAVQNQIAASPVTPIVMNVRLGRDFRKPDPQLVMQGGAVRTPVSWFVKALRTVRTEVGNSVPALVVSDGKRVELAPLLAEPNTILARTSLAAADLMLLSRARYLIGTGGSSFSAWGGFLSQAEVITVEGQSLEWFNLNMASTGKIRTIPFCDR